MRRSITPASSLRPTFDKSGPSVPPTPSILWQVMQCLLKARTTVRCVVGADRVGRLVAGIERKWMGADTRHDIVMVNGTPGLLTWRNGVPDAITSLHVVDGRIAAIYVVRNPDKLGGLSRVAG